MVKFGYTPENFNIALVTPIPKKGVMEKPSDYRPISVSTTFALLFESLILEKANFDDLLSSNQFGYRKRTSCKHAYFMVNEAINYYRSGKSDLKIVSLDATKAFDKLWREGLFYKLYAKVDEWIWRSIVSYYNQSKIVVRIKDKFSEIYKINQGVKQGGKLSGFLFNFFINELIEECLKLNIGAKISQKNISIIAYCDDILLISPTCYHMNILVETCYIYSQKWKMDFNPKKSNLVCFGQDNSNLDVKMNGLNIPRVENMVYLGFPIGEKKYIENYIEKKFQKVEKSLYSLYSFGCNPHGLNPKTIGFIFKQFCQSLFRYGLEFYHLSAKMIDSYNIRQNILIKRSIGLSKYVKTKPLFKCLKVDSIEQIYFKHKISLFKQIKANNLTSEVFKSLYDVYEKKVIKSDNSTLYSQLKDVNKKLNIIDCTEDIAKSKNAINRLSDCTNQGLIDSINFVLSEVQQINVPERTRILTGLLNNGFLETLNIIFFFFLFFTIFFTLIYFVIFFYF